MSRSTLVETSDPEAQTSTISTLSKKVTESYNNSNPEPSGLDYRDTVVCNPVPLGACWGVNQEIEEEPTSVSRPAAQTLPDT